MLETNFRLSTALKTLRKNILYIYTDGSSFSGLRKGGIGVRYVILDNVEEEIVVDKEIFGYQQGSNNQMELKACVLALENCLDAMRGVAFDSIEIRSDSIYVTDNVSNAKYEWPKTKWLGKDGKPILWKELSREIRRLGVRIDFQWVKGDAKDEHNKAVDKAAKTSAKSAINEPLSFVIVRRKKTKQKTKIGSVGIMGQRVCIRYNTPWQILRLFTTQHCLLFYPKYVIPLVYEDTYADRIQPIR